jgi:hypothetical protein
LEGKFGAVEWIRTTTVFLPPAPQAGASANSATTAPQANFEDLVCQTPALNARFSTSRCTNLITSLETDSAQALVVAAPERAARVPEPAEAEIVLVGFVRASLAQAPCQTFAFVRELIRFRAGLSECASPKE